MNKTENILTKDEVFEALKDWSVNIFDTLIEQVAQEPEWNKEKILKHLRIKRGKIKDTNLNESIL